MRTNTAKNIESAIDKFLSDRSISFKVIEYGLVEDLNWNRYSFMTTFKREDNRTCVIEVPFSQGIAITENPTPATVIHSLILDLIDGRTFEEWCSDFGYDTDSRSKERIYNECVLEEYNTRQCRILYRY